MQRLLQTLVPSDAGIQQKLQVVSLVSDNCSNQDDVQVVAALHHRFGEDVTREPINNLISTHLDDITDTSRAVLPLLMQKIPLARDQLYTLLQERIELAADVQRLDTLLEFTYFLLLNDTQPLPDAMIHTLWSQLNCEEDETANLVARILGIKSYSGNEESAVGWWSNIEMRILSPSKGELPAYKAWLSWIQHGPESIQRFVSTTKYWQLVQRGITKLPRSTERIKYSLSILDLSLKSLRSPIDLEIMRWDPASKECRNLWTRYVALVEIISVDLSYNQAEESKDDIFTLCQHSKTIAPSWVLALLQSGLTTQAENIRSFIVDTVFKFPDLHVFNSDPTFIVSYLLPLAIEAPNFKVEDEERCPYIGVISEFMARLLASLDHESRIVFIDTLIVEYQQQVYAYDAPRIYILKEIANSSIKLPHHTLDIIGKYGNSARRVSKSLALGWIIYKQCVHILVQSGTLNEETLSLVELYFPTSDTFELIPAIASCVPNTLRELIALRAHDKALYFILYSLLQEQNNWTPLELISHPQADVIVNYFQRPVLGKSVLALATSQLELNGFLEEETRRACSYFPSDINFSVVNDGDITSALFEAQVKSLKVQTYLPSDKLLELLGSSEFSSGRQNNRQRLLNGYRVKYLADMLMPSDEIWPQAVLVLTNAFSHDFTPAQMSVLAAFERLLDSEGSVIGAEVGECLTTMWELLNEYGLKASDRDLHLQFIKVLTHKKIFNSEICGSYLRKVALDIVAQSHARKNLLCPLVRGISQHQTLPSWACETLVAAYTLIRTRHSIFYLEDIILKQFSQYEKFWGENERNSRALAINALANQPQHAEVIASYALQPQYRLFTCANYHDGAEENIRILCFQILTIMEKSWSLDFCKGLLLPNLVKAIDTEASKLVRVYIEWLISRLVIRDMNLLNSTVFDPLRNCQEPRFVSSLGRIGLLIGKGLGENMPREYWNEYLDIIIPLSTCNKAAIRHFTVTMIYAIHIDTNMRSKLEPRVQQWIDGIAKCAASSDQFQNFKQGDDCVWNVISELTLTGVCGGVLSRLYQYDPHHTVTRGEFIGALGQGNWGDDYSQYKPEDVPMSQFAQLTTIRDGVLTDNIQTKAGTDEETKRGDLIVVASLCDIPVNLGGICRMSDALGVKLLTLNDMKVAKHPQFKSTCVTADRWQPMCEVPEGKIAEFLLQQKRQGYTLIGLEQTDNSRRLEPSLVFPKKSLLLIGRERQGIPGSLLAYLDFCVEIEQWGVVRSMNVQTATAVIVHAYNHQNC